MGLQAQLQMQLLSNQRALWALPTGPVAPFIMGLGAHYIVL